MTPGGPGAGLADALHPAWAALDRRLAPDRRAPLALGFSGGSDSLALLCLAVRWAAGCGRRVQAFTVDHRLHPDSAAWTAAAGAAARALGADWSALAWSGDRPAAGLPAAARAARHALLAQAAREAGAAVLLLGHTADDAEESELIRAETPTHGRLAQWAPSPAWPQGRGLFLLRPLLQVRRAALRDGLRAQGLDWLEDPANADARFARTRARASLSGHTGELAPVPREGRRTQARRPPPFEGKGGWGALHGVREALLRSAHPDRILGKALLCVGGGARPPAGAAVARLLERLDGGADFAATLAGARLQARGEALQLTREPGRRAPAALLLPPGQAVVFDGRFELLASAVGWRVAGLAGHAAALPRREREALRAAPALARPSLPVLLDRDGRARLPAPFAQGPAHARSLVAERLDAALGRIGDEGALVASDPHGRAARLILS